MTRNLSSGPETPLLWLNHPASEDDDPNSVRLLLLPSHRVDFAARIAQEMPHGTPQQWDTFLIAAKKAEPHKFGDGPYSPEARAERLAKMTAAQRLEEANRKGGNK